MIFSYILKIHRGTEEGMMEEYKNKRKASIRDTRMRRKAQTVAIIKTKIDNGKLNSNTRKNTQ